MSIEVIRTRGRKPYEMCRQLSPPDGLDMPKFCCFQSDENGEVFIGQIRSGAWCEINQQELAMILNDMQKKIDT